MAHPYSTLTVDIDFLGSSDDAISLSRKLSDLACCVMIPTLDDYTPNSGKIAIYTNNTKVDFYEIDFLYTITGINQKHAKERAILVNINNLLLHVLNPLDCLVSRFSNLVSHSSKRSPEGFLQAELAIQIANNYIRSLPKRRALKACEEVIDLAVSEVGKRCYALSLTDKSALNELNLLDAIPVADLPADFQTIRWPQIQSHLNEKLDKFCAQYKVDRPQPL
jgi:hypothetical protein